MGHFNSTEKSAAATAGTKVRALPCACTQPGRAYHEGMDRPTLEALQRLMDVLWPLHHLNGCEPFSSHHVNTCTMPAEAGPRNHRYRTVERNGNASPWQGEQLHNITTVNSTL